MRTPIEREGYSCIFTLLLLAAVVGIFAAWWALVPLMAALCIAAFFRDPRRRIPDDPEAVIAPAAGRITAIGECEEHAYMKGRVRRISIFMSVFDVHVNYSPVGGTVDFLHHRPGSFINALKEAASAQNERVLVGITSHNGRRMAFAQIAGLIARRIVCRCSVGERVKAGQKIGMIKFGSRVDIFLPLSYAVMVKVGEKVCGGESCIARVL